VGGCRPTLWRQEIGASRVLLKLYIYGYLNRVQSSRRLEREAGRNVEVMWLTGRLAPDHKTMPSLDLNWWATTVTSSWRMANIAPDDALILPHRAESARMEFSGTTASSADRLWTLSMMRLRLDA
jgi:hypothetical protein